MTRGRACWCSAASARGSRSTYDQVAVAYSDSAADLPLLKAARKPVVVNPKPSRVAMFRRVLPEGTPILNWGCESRGGDR